MCSETSKNNVDYKNTLSLPETDFPMRAGLPTREPIWLEHWEKLDIYNTLRKRTGRNHLFYMMDRLTQTATCILAMH